MAVRDVYIEVPRERVWRVLATGTAYAEWVVGTREVRSVDPAWPAVGAELHFTAGYGPWALHDRTVVRVSRPPERLELEIHAGRFGTIRAALQLIEWGAGTVVVLDEHPLRGIGATLHSPTTELFLNLRNRLALDNLAKVALRAAEARRTGVVRP
ncbi:polyketide cyclase/dehydrase/lipid transport protein [Actinocorallia herbida]|uniref:Polyketide cyclase/dehydrase/lipid transport protein n=1 Tax=Actinocorallia herbida TaxID=58109 RepID=A0A3N1D564_9ACTN|nr:SRPBCC family protein [Actinocorallia herbida]ROO88667.1 polyketide cyclase/dehydrase/lipid transport protein [Actinocorallia herbida]